MIPSAAIAIFQNLVANSKQPANRLACEMAIAALQKEALMSEVIQKSGGQVLIVDHVQQDEGMWYVVTIHGGATVGAKTLVDALQGLLEKLGDKVKP